MSDPCTSLTENFQNCRLPEIYVNDQNGATRKLDLSVEARMDVT